MKNIKTYENFTRIAADIYFGDNGDEFTSVNDPFTIEYCLIEFPLGEKMIFKVISEDFISDTLNLKIGTFGSLDRISSHEMLLNIFGNNIQFHSLNEYKLVRKYMTKEDLFDHTFESYIYHDTSLGFSEITVRILESKDSSGQGLGTGYSSYDWWSWSRNIVDITKNKDWRIILSDFIEDDGFFETWEKLEDMLDEFDKVKPINVIVDYATETQTQTTIIELLYLSFIIGRIPFSKRSKIVSIIRNPNREINISDIIDLIRLLI